MDPINLETYPKHLRKMWLQLRDQFHLWLNLSFSSEALGMTQKVWINANFFSFIPLKLRNQLWTKSHQHWSIDCANGVANTTGFLKAYTRILLTKEAVFASDRRRHRVWDNQTHKFNTNFNTNTPGLTVLGFLQKAWNHPTNGSC